MVSLSSYEFSELTPVPYRSEVSWSLWASTRDEISPSHYGPVLEASDSRRDYGFLEQSISEKQERQQRIILHFKGRLQMTETNGRVHLLLSVQFRYQGFRKVNQNSDRFY
ncbi:MAG: hypothetical protein EZS28_011490 [Streblomastix strix]|uniref:Uncharacterized protein n=1 Tax=Streblomastix strix TaxID=222440 RepID=A0A5J4WDB8_9EUKA|nr:MAG: hypothetical protein EZS28_011490 [Streblomastix strix]